MRMKLKFSTILGATAAVLVSALGAQAQTALKWAHVYETSEPFHTESVWAAEEIAKRTDGRYKIDVFPASQLGKEADINQGLKLGTVDIIISGSSFAARALSADRRHLLPLHLPRSEPPDRLYQERCLQEARQGYEEARAATTSLPSPITARATRPRTSR
jgi:ABC-type glycerol-3-phosphate transport system substrate-binding protein